MQDLQQWQCLSHLHHRIFRNHLRCLLNRILRQRYQSTHLFELCVCYCQLQAVQIGLHLPRLLHRIHRKSMHLLRHRILQQRNCLKCNLLFLRDSSWPQLPKLRSSWHLSFVQDGMDGSNL